MLFPRLARYKDVVSNFSLIKVTYVFGKHWKMRSVGHIGLFTILTTPRASCTQYHSDRATSSEGRVGKATTVGPLKTRI